MKKTIFALFDSYSDAKAALDSLVEHDFSEDEMNVLVREQLAKEQMEVDLHEVDIQKSDEVGEVTIRGLPRLLGGQQPVHLPGVGDVLAAGNVATVMARTASSTGTADVGLKQALVEMNVPEDLATTFREALAEGGVLFWIRTGEEKAPAAAGVLREENGRHVADYAGKQPLS